MISLISSKHVWEGKKKKKNLSCILFHSFMVYLSDGYRMGWVKSRELCSYLVPFLRQEKPIWDRRDKSKVGWVRSNILIPNEVTSIYIYIYIWVWLISSTFLTGISFYFNERLSHHLRIKENVKIKIHYHLLLYI